MGGGVGEAEAERGGEAAGVCGKVRGGGGLVRARWGRERRMKRKRVEWKEVEEWLVHARPSNMLGQLRQPRSHLWGRGAGADVCH